MNTLHRIRLAMVVGITGVLLVSCSHPGSAPSPDSQQAAPAVAVPAPLIDESAPTPGETRTAILAGGCFWGVQGIFQHVKGVTEALSGYVGGSEANAHYEIVSTGKTGHAESVRITYDPSQVTFGQLLRVFFAVVQDPTEFARQGPDIGGQYRSAIFPQNDGQKRVADAYIAQLGDTHLFNAPIVTRTETPTAFFPAEGYHQNYLDLHPDQPYIAINDIPKVKNLKLLFPQLYREQPVLVPVTAR